MTVNKLACRLYFGVLLFTTAVLFSVNAFARWTHAIYRFSAPFDTAAVKYSVKMGASLNDRTTKRSMEGFLNSNEIIECYSNEECTVLNHVSTVMNAGKGLKLDGGGTLIARPRASFRHQSIMRYSDSLYCDHVFRNSKEEWHSFKINWADYTIIKTGKKKRIENLNCWLYSVTDSNGRKLDFYLSNSLDKNTHPGFQLPNAEGGVVLITNGKASLKLVSYEKTSGCPYADHCKGDLEKQSVDLIGNAFFIFYSF